MLSCPYGSVARESLGREMHCYVYQRQRYSILYRHLRRHSWDPTEAWRLGVRRWQSCVRRAAGTKTRGN